MKKQTRTLAVLAVLVVACLGGYFALKAVSYTHLWASRSSRLRRRSSTRSLARASSCPRFRARDRAAEQPNRSLAWGAKVWTNVRRSRRLLSRRAFRSLRSPRTRCV